MSVSLQGHHPQILIECQCNQPANRLENDQKARLRSFSSLERKRSTRLRSRSRFSQGTAWRTRYNPDGRPNAHHRRLPCDPSSQTSRPLQYTLPQHPYSRHDRVRHSRRPRKVPESRHGRLPRQTRQSQNTRENARPLGNQQTHPQHPN